MLTCCFIFPKFTPQRRPYKPGVLWSHQHPAATAQHMQLPKGPGWGPIAQGPGQSHYLLLDSS